MAILSIAVSIITIAQTATKPAILYGTITQNDLREAPFSNWFDSTYNAYQPDTKITSGIKKSNSKDISIEIFLGTWCGDSKREVPRFMKLLRDASFTTSQVKLIGGSSDSLYKQGPEQEEAGKGIFRVPVFIVYKNGVELGRINEFPVTSLEKDLQTILTGEDYSPNYKSFALLNEWLTDGTLTNKNSNIRGMAMQLKSLVSSERELNSVGYLLLQQEKKQEAFKIFQLNAQLYPESANVLSSLGEGYYKTGDAKMAVQLLEKALEINKDPLLVKEILKILYEVKGLKG
ncbi:hypothetical protein CAP36_15060 [Chitinophagaceae bacterium IBVUCB2]|nr:hypothetical protein CAP36_15060 [Chitinophagaceae bacterium IBVUCB2]